MSNSEVLSNYFVRSGGFYLANNAMRYIGTYGYSWSGTATFYNDSTATWQARSYHPYFTVSDVEPSGTWYRWLGIPVRCLVY